MGAVKIIPFGMNVIECLVSDVLKENGDVSAVTIVFSHRRPITYSAYYFSRMIKDRVFVLPEMYAFQDWVNHLFVTSVPEYAHRVTINEYDQAWIAYLAARDLIQVRSWEEFFPWAMRIADLIKELDQELIDPSNIYYPPAENLPDVGIKIIEQVGTFYQRFNQILGEGYITPSKKLRILAEKAALGHLDFHGTRIYFAGFYALTQAETLLLQEVFRQGGTIYWQADHLDLPPFYRKWKQDWKISEEEIQIVEGGEQRSTKYVFYEAHDLHSELEELQRRVTDVLPKKDLSKPDKCGIVLPSSESLIPLLFCLPHVPINITLGYPLTLTGIYAFFNILRSIVCSARRESKETPIEQSKYHLRKLIELFRSPYIETLMGNADIGRLETLLLEYGTPYMSKEEICALCIFRGDSELSNEVENLFEKMIFPFCRLKTPRDMAILLVDFITQRQPYAEFIEREFLSAIIHHVVPILEYSFFSREEMSSDSLFKLFLGIFGKARVPFEGEPLVGLQVVGPLEARLLQFEVLFILDVNEGILPGDYDINPLLPQQIREILGFPDRFRHESIYHYHFHCLVRSAIETHIFYQSRLTGVREGLDGKKVRSRYVEELLWELERERGFLCSGEEKLPIGDMPYPIIDRSVLDLHVGSFPSETIAFNKGEGTRKRIEDIIRGGITPTLLNMYLRCPLSFFYARVLGIKPTVLPKEIDPPELGSLVHDAMQQFFRDLCKQSKKIGKQTIKPEDLYAVFWDKFSNTQPFQNLPESKKFILLEVARFRLGRFVESLPAEFEVACLEQTVTCEINLLNGFGSIPLKGRFDRVDVRRNQDEAAHYVIVDYKTGYVTLPGSKMWQLSIPRYLDGEGLAIIYEAVKDIQLLFYVYLWGCYLKNKGKIREIPFRDILACVVKLGSDGSEQFLRKQADDDYVKFFMDTFPLLLRYIVRHMIEAPWVRGATSQVCTECEYRLMCRYGE